MDSAFDKSLVSDVEHLLQIDGVIVVRLEGRVGEGALVGVVPGLEPPPPVIAEVSLHAIMARSKYVLNTLQKNHAQRLRDSYF